jgi:hypothetical protein
MPREVDMTEVRERARVTKSQEESNKITTAPIGPVPAPDGSWAVRHRYLLLAAAVTVLTTIQTVNGQWSSDMWEHVAVVRGLIDDPFSATAGLSLLDTPYTVTLGMLGSVLGVSAVTMLSIAAIANVVLLLGAFRLFVLEATQNRRAPFWALGFLLVLWGPSPYRFSGFFNLNSIGFVLPFPSAFATAIALLVLTAALRASRDHRWQWFAAVAAGTTTVVLVHPITALWLAAGLLAIAVSRMRDVRAWIWLVGAGSLGLAMTLAWPYFRVFDLVGETDAGLANRSMYEDVLLRLLPVAVIGLWVLWRRLRVDRRDLLGLMLGGALAIYVYGYVTDEYVYGRSLALVVIVLDVAAGDGVGRLEERFQWRRARGWVRAGAVTLGALLVFGLIFTRGGLVRMVPTRLLPASVRTSDELARVDDEYGFLSRFVSGNDVVIGATDEDNRVIPAVAGQPLRPYWKAPGPSDAMTRAAAQAEFLDPATSSARRAEIRARFKVRFVLLHARDGYASSLIRALESEGATVAYDEDGFRLLALPAVRESS